MQLSKIFLFTFILLTLFSCQKSKDDIFLQKDLSGTSQYKSKQSLDYGKEVFYLKKNQKFNIVSPKSVPGKKGTFKAIPEGLAIDPVSGDINIKESLSGMRYKIYFENKFGKLIDSTQVVISGLDYEDGIYEVDKSSNQNSVSMPILNADKSLKLPRKSNGNNGDYIFDETISNNDRISEKAGVIYGTLVVDKKTGAILVGESLNAGFFGSPVPSNGTSRSFKLNYRLNDESEEELNQVDILFVYYKTKEDIPKEVLDVLKKRKRLQERVDAKSRPGNAGEVILNDSEIIDPFDLKEYARKRRPPLIIIVG